MRSPTRAARLLTVGALTAATLVIGAGAASAHVTVSPSTAEAGGYAVLTFRVPNESDTAGTVGLTIHFPTDTPLASVRYQNVPGWTAKAVTEQLPKPVTEGAITIDKAVTSVTFTAAGGTKIAPGEFAQFDLSVGPLPDVPALSFPTDQTYDDGSVVKWADKTVAGAAEPDHPAPTVTLTAAADDTAGHSHSADATVQATPEVGQAAVAVGSADTLARVLGIVGIVLAALSLFVGALGLRRRSAGPGRRVSSPASAEDDDRS
ncbi:YcnI family copper-binding membrane protein [Nakamurella lactea]|uniref:YcnI family copper-binding membrane protein n=1 Tax=Nakamurella lactea TaxID=459515 RepID=UPI0003FF08F7|nr:YcnI family protein [Nakamurella lactea]